MLFPNAFIRLERAGVVILGGATSLPYIVQLDDSAVGEDAGLVEIQPGSSSALAPTLKKTIYDVPSGPGGPIYQRGDVVTILGGTGQYSAPVANPFHVLRVLTPYQPLPATEVSIARMDILTQPATWVQVITADSPGVVAAPDWDPAWAHEQTFTDGTYGVGFSAPDPVTGLLRHGYFAGRPITIGVNEYAVSLLRALEGFQVYEGPVILYEAPVVLNKGDLVVTGDGRRMVIADTIHQFQRTGVILGTLARVEAPNPGTLIYQVPLT